MRSSSLLIIVTLCTIIKVIASDAIPPAPSSAPALPNIPGLSSIVDDLMKVVEKAKSRWDALQNGYGSGYVSEITNSGQTKPDKKPGLGDIFLNSLTLGNLLFPNRKRGSSRTDPQSQMSFTFPLPYQFQTEQQIRRSSQVNPVSSPAAVYIPKNVAPSMKLIHRPAAPVSNCLYGKTGTLCQDLSTLPQTDNVNDWEDLFANIQLTEY